MKRAQREAIIDTGTAAVAQAIEDAGLASNSCILASRLMVEYLRAYRLRARALPVKLSVFNPVYVKYMKEYRGLGSVPDEVKRQAKREGAWAVVVGQSEDERAWSGHVVVVAEERYLVDPTAHQVERLKKGINAEPFWTESRELARGQHTAFLNAEDRCLWIYEPDPKNNRFLSMPAWSGYRVSVRDGCVVSERCGVRPDVPVAEVVKVPL